MLTKKEQPQSREACEHPGGCSKTTCWKPTLRVSAPQQGCRLGETLLKSTGEWYSPVTRLERSWKAKIMVTTSCSIKPKGHSVKPGRDQFKTGKRQHFFLQQKVDFWADSTDTFSKWLDGFSSILQSGRACLPWAASSATAAGGRPVG